MRAALKTNRILIGGLALALAALVSTTSFAAQAAKPVAVRRNHCGSASRVPGGSRSEETSAPKSAEPSDYERDYGCPVTIATEFWRATGGATVPGCDRGAPSRRTLPALTIAAVSA
jgi:hypothetical protein